LHSFFLFLTITNIFSSKTIQTISLISYLACEKQVWGPHLIVVPTSVMLNWEMEFKRFAPGFKVLTYYGNPMQRKEKRRGWNKEDTWHVCITSYQLVLQDQNAFKRKKWHYLILDEAHNIKNFRSQRWQSLLNFNTQHRLLLTGTPLQNNLVELWSLLYFLMPSSRASESMPEGFANLRNFQEWFSRPVEKMVEGGEYVDEEVKSTVAKLHVILRPYLLRRLKADVEKQMPAKYEHIVYCKLSKRQRYLYDDFMSRAQTRETLASGNFLSIINCLMQLRKVCNHPDLFEVRPIVTSLAIEKSVSTEYEEKDRFVRKLLLDEPIDQLNLDFLNLQFTQNDFTLTQSSAISCKQWIADEHQEGEENVLGQMMKELRDNLAKSGAVKPDFSTINGHSEYMAYLEQQAALTQLQTVVYQSKNKCERTPVYGRDLIHQLTIVKEETSEKTKGYNWAHSEILSRMKLNYAERELYMSDMIEKFSFVTPKIVCLNMAHQVLGPVDDLGLTAVRELRSQSMFHHSQVKLSIAFPDKRLLQYDCGKLQRLAVLLQELIAGGHRALIFTQMTRVLDVLERFLNLHGLRYLRLDGATKIEQRQILTERFNQDTRIPIFILSTRSGGLGINLTGADTVIFYDSDWNPSMDKQCQDRCHRIGQTRDVHIYRLVSEYTIESNILKKAQQKQILDNVVIQEGEFTTDYFNKLSVRDMLGDEVVGTGLIGEESIELGGKNLEKALAQAEDADDAAAAAVAMREVNNIDAEDFVEDERQRKSRTATPTASATPKPEQGGGTLGRAATEEMAEYDEDDLDDVGHVDDYMIRFIEGGYYWD
jgi:helicase SWR1